MKIGLRARVFSRRNFFGAMAGGFGGLGYMRFGEAEWLEVNQPAVKLGLHAATEIKVLHLSDFHASQSVGLEFIEEAVELGVSLKPNLVCLTGDFITSKYDLFQDYGRVLKKLSAVAPAFACIGNHDGGSWVRRRCGGYTDWSLVGAMLKHASITVLHNAALAVEVNGKSIQLVGLGDLWAQELDARKAFENAENAMTTVVLSHNPDSKSTVADFRWDLMLCGHTHGGQCKLPFLGTPFAPVIDQRYVAGLKEWRGRWIHVTKGVGNLHGMRFNCRPEVSLLRMTV